ncbi:MAG: hypothetical protein JXA04_09730 [Gammaproteobacteria bacterium]|nr:hypothetical protein [Gammaproteobacteria bacterium]
MKGLKLFGITLFAAVLGGCASTGADIPRVSDMLRESTGQNGRACVRQMDIRSYGVLDNDVVSINATRKYYLATVWPGCNDLQTSMRAMFKGGFGEVCGGSTNKIATGGDQCVIRQMFEFKSRDEAFETYNALMEKRKEMREAADSKVD